MPLPRWCRFWQRSFMLAMLVPLLAILGCSIAPKPAYMRCPPQAFQRVAPAPIGPTMPTIQAGVAGATLSAVPTFGAEQLQLRTLVIGATGSEPAFAAIGDALARIGVPFTPLILAERPLTDDLLHDGRGGGLHNAVILATDEVVPGRGDGQLELSADAWSLLQEYRQRHRVRQVTFQATLRPGTTDHGLADGEVIDAHADAVRGYLTEAGRAAFGYLNPAEPIDLQGGRVAVGRPDAPLVPVLVADDGRVIGHVREDDPGGPSMVLLIDQDPRHRHSTLLEYGVINWVNQGLFVGERHVYLAVQPDDFFISNRLWDPDRGGQGVEAYRMTDEDWMETLAWQREVRERVRNAADFRIEWPYNGRGANVHRPSSEPLTDLVRQQQGEFLWVSHTYDHVNFDALTCDEVIYQAKANEQTALRLGLANFTPIAAVTPEVSGLDNAEALRGLAAAGVRFLVSDTSDPTQASPRPNWGIRSVHQPSILLIPRHATEIYYDTSTPAEQIAEYNHRYRAERGAVTDFSQIVQAETDKMLWRNLLRYELSPFMFHQSNLRLWQDPSGGRGQLMPEVLDALFEKYNEVYDLPIVTLPLHEIGQRMLRRMECDEADQQAALSRDEEGRPTLTLVVDRPCAMAVTGLATGTFELYGGQPIAYIPLRPGQAMTIPFGES